MSKADVIEVEGEELSCKSSVANGFPSRESEERLIKNLKASVYNANGGVEYRLVTRLAPSLARNSAEDSVRIGRALGDGVSVHIDNDLALNLSHILESVIG